MSKQNSLLTQSMCQCFSEKYSRKKNELKLLLFYSLGGKHGNLIHGRLTPPPPPPKKSPERPNLFNYLVYRKYTGMIYEGILQMYSNGLLMAQLPDDMRSISFHICEPFRSYGKPLKTSVLDWFKNITYLLPEGQARLPLPHLFNSPSKPN